MREPDTAVPVLSLREWEVLSLLADGHTSEAVAAKLGISVRTVTRRESAACRSLGVTTRMAAAAEAARRAII